MHHPAGSEPPGHESWRLELPAFETFRNPAKMWDAVQHGQNHERVLEGRSRVFLSSDVESIPVGEKWLLSIEQALADCVALVVLCSHESKSRPWINFEAGAAWIRNVPVIPVCHGGLQPNELPLPLSLRAGIIASESDGLSRLYGRIAKRSVVRSQVGASAHAAVSSRR